MKFPINQLKDFLLVAFFILICAIFVGLALRGLPGNPKAAELNTVEWKEAGPLELSPERGRYALTYSIVEENSFRFSNTIGEFAKPDVAVQNGQFVSLFAPGVSLVVLPGYLLGKSYGLAQVGSFAVISIFALINVLLLRSVAIKLGANRLAATIGAAVFLFATPAFTYSVDLYQHHISTFMILMSIWSLLYLYIYVALLVVFFLCASSIMIDNPNLFFMFPIGVYAIGKILNIKQTAQKISIQFSLLKSLTVVIMIVPLALFAWTNYMSYGNPLQLAGTLKSAKETKVEKLEATMSATIATPSAALVNPIADQKKKEAINFFKTRHMVNGFYIHFISPDRGLIYYTPVMVFGLLALVVAYKRNVRLGSVLVGVFGINVLLYTMWGDAWGGWAFGSRYLIPGYSILAIFIALLLSWWRKNILFLMIFSLVLVYSVGVNTLGAITSSRNPPQVEVLELEKQTGIVQKYTPERNWDMLMSNFSKSYVFQTYAKNHLSAYDYFVYLTTGINSFIIGMILLMYLKSFNYSFIKILVKKIRVPKIVFPKLNTLLAFKRKNSK